MEAKNPEGHAALMPVFMCVISAFPTSSPPCETLSAFRDYGKESASQKHCSCFLRGLTRNFGYRFW